jgi:hypothetical protein
MQLTTLFLAALLTALSLCSQAPVDNRSEGISFIKFHHGYKAEDKRSGIDIGIFVSRSTPYSRAHASDEWTITWGCRKRGDRVEFDVLSNGPVLHHEIRVVKADEQDLSLRNPNFNVPLNSVIAIRVTVTRGAKEVARTEFH